MIHPEVKDFTRRDTPPPSSTNQMHINIKVKKKQANKKFQKKGYTSAREIPAPEICCGL
jgi:hypothetical protein